MPFVDPMLASPMRDSFELKPNEWSAEEKFDGHRMIISVDEKGGDLFGNSAVIAWSRNGLPRVLPPHLRLALGALSSGIYDGELINPGLQSTGVTIVEDQDKLQLIIFDVIEIVGRDVKKERYRDRRLLLEMMFGHEKVTSALKGTSCLKLASSTEINTMDEVYALRDAVWERKGEGLILKRRASLYCAGKRTKDWIKVKELKSFSGPVVGFKQGEMGPFSRWVFRDPVGLLVPVKWKSLELLRDFEKSHQKYIEAGRIASIEYQNRADDGGYRHPRFDHWES